MFSEGQPQHTEVAGPPVWLMCQEPHHPHHLTARWGVSPAMTKDLGWKQLPATVPSLEQLRTVLDGTATQSLLYPLLALNRV